jgi:hypothetical protein
MYARRTVSRLPPERAGTAKELIEAGLISKGRNLPGFSGGYWLMDVCSGEGLAFTFFDTWANLQASAVQAGQLRTFAADSIGAEMSAVGHFEVAADTGQKVHRRASHARVLNYVGDPVRLDDVIQMVPAKVTSAWVRPFGASIGGFWLADRENGTGVRVTLFDSAINLAGSRDRIAQLREQSAAQVPGAFSEFAEYEVVALEETPSRRRVAGS